MYGAEPYVIARGGTTCFTALWLCGGEGSKKRQHHCLAFGDLLSIHPISSHFTHSLYVTGALPAVALVVNPRVDRFAYVLSPCGPFKWTLLKIRQFLLPPQPHWFLYPDVMGIYLPGARTLGCEVWPGAGIPPNIYLPHVSVGLPVRQPLPLHTTPHHTTPPLCASLSISVTLPFLPIGSMWLL